MDTSKILTDSTHIQPSPHSFNRWDGEKQSGLEVIPSDESKRTCGLRPPNFWLLVILIVVVVVGGVGGGIGGAVAVHQASKSGAGQSAVRTKTVTQSVPTTTSKSPSTTSLIPSATPPIGCSETYTSTFELVEYNFETGDNLGRITCGDPDCKFTLTDGVLKSDLGEIYYVARDYSFSLNFEPSNHDPIYTGGFSMCANNTLLLGNSATWYSCFNSFYYKEGGPKCFPVYFQAVPA